MLFVIRAGWQGMRILGADVDLGRALNEANNLLKKSPIVIENPVAQFDDPKEHECINYQGKNVPTIAYNQSAIFRVHWPKKNQEIAWHSMDPYPDYAGPVVEDFLIAYDGWAFCAAAKTSEPLPLPYSFVFGREVRRILESIFGGGEFVTVRIERMGIGPTPMFPVFYVSNSPDKPDFNRDLVPEFDTLESLHIETCDDAALESRVASLMSGLLEPTHRHFDDLSLRNQCLITQEELDDAFTEATESFTRLIAPKGFNPKLHFLGVMEGRTLRRSVGQYYLRYARYQETRGQLQRNSSETSRMFGSDPLLHGEINYPIQETEPVLRFDYSHTIEAIRFLGEESRSRGMELATVQSAVVWALVGIVAVWLLSQVL